MASSGKKKTTMAKIMREAKLRERRAAKKARKDDRKRNGPGSADADAVTDNTTAENVDEQPVDSGVGITD